MCRVLFLIVVMAVFVVLTQGQLTFSTDWGNGKRSLRSDPGVSDRYCRNEESLFAIYKLIQKEADKFLACQMDVKTPRPSSFVPSFPDFMYWTGPTKKPLM